MVREHLKIEMRLVTEGIMTPRQLEEFQQIQTSYKKETVEALLIKMGYVTEEQLTQVIGKYLRVPYINLKTYTVDYEVVNLLDEKMAREYQVLAIDRKGNRLTLCMTDPLNLYAIEEVRLVTGLVVDVGICTQADMYNMMEHCYGDGKSVVEAHPTKKILSVNEKRGIEEDPLVKMVNDMLIQGIELGASDIHIEAGPVNTRVRMRIDRVLQEQMPIHKDSHDLVVGRIKVMAQMNTAEKRIPQDGQFQIRREEKQINMRVSTLPTIYGEKVVIRILNTQGNNYMSIDKLGFTPSNRRLFDKMIKSPHGLILVTGPTGSGKSTTLYSILSEHNKVTDNIVTLEDPIEKRLEGINQVQINNKAGLTFASGLRSILRQDPDIIMLGEIRDAETASIAIRSAITGHIVFSTLHTNDAASTMIRLVDMGVEPYLVGSALVGVIAQRLVRKICPCCKMPYQSTEDELKLLKLEGTLTLHKGRGCQVCNFTGYKGRIALHEIIVVNSELQTMINRGMQAEAIRAYAKTQGTTFLQDNMCQLIVEGTTSTEEFIKTIYSI